MTGITNAINSPVPTLLSKGGTNAALTADQGAVPYSTSSAIALLASTATARQMFQSGSSAAPAWSTTTWPATTTVNRILYSSSASVIGEISAANSASLVTTNAGVPAFTSSLTNGQLVIGSTGATPTPGTLTQGSGITITNGAGSITIASTGSVPWTEVTGTSQAMTINNGYVANNAGLVTLTIPPTAAFGTIFEVTGKGAGLWLIQANTGQTIIMNGVASTVAGSVASTAQYDCIKLLTTAADTTFTVIRSEGANFTLA